MKASIRVSILTFFTSLLVIVGISIVTTNYYLARSDILGAIKNLAFATNQNIEAYIVNFLGTMRADSNYATELIKNKLIEPTDTNKFNKLLLQIIDDDQNFYAVHWNEPNGNSYYLEKSKNNTFLVNSNLCKPSGCYQLIQRVSSDGHLLERISFSKSNYDPRTRPWYQKALQNKGFALSDVYLFFDTPVLGVTSGYPAYDKDNKLIGVFGIDLKLTNLSSFLEPIKVSANSQVYIYTSNYALVAAPSLKNFTGNTLPTVAGISKDWTKNFFVEVKKRTKTAYPAFIYKVNNIDYLASYIKVAEIPNVDWNIALLLPLSDVTKNIKDSLITSILFGLIVLVIGAIGIWIISARISKPIVKLADETALIRKLLLPPTTQANSRLKEIFYMQDAFNAMKQSLKSFARYVPFTLVKNLIASGELAHVGGNAKNITCLFSDIQNFTGTSENMAPPILMEYLSEYFEAMTKTIITNNGTLDKYIGDGIMAFWGAPVDDNNHAIHACQSALAMLTALAKLNDHLRSNNLPEISIRIGMNTGEVIVGNVGSEDRLSYTAIGDSINVASRLENLNKLYNTKILVSENTYQEAKDNFTFRKLDYVAVKGRQKGIYIYELLSENNFIYDNAETYNNEFAAAFAYYLSGNWDKASREFINLAAKYSDDQIANLYVKRCQYFAANPPEKWDGIWKIENKL